MIIFEVRVLSMSELRRGTRLNGSGIKAIIPKPEILGEVLCPAGRDSMFLEPFTTLSSVGLKNAGSWMMIGTGKTSSSV
jgi:hypothetical protein